MKKIIVIAFAIFSILILSSVSALPTDQCSVDKLEIETIATEVTTTAKINYYFECAQSAYGEQITKMIVTIPYKDAYNIEASDAIGDMKVFEGPAYTGVTRSDTDATIGSFFRKSIVLETNSTAGYMLTLEFQSDYLVKQDQKVYTINPKGLGANPKITMVGTGVTETVVPVSDIDYTLTLPTGSAVTSTPSGCSLSEGTVTCTGLTAAELDKIEVKWTGTGPGILFTRVRDLAKNLPGTFTNIFKSIFSIFK